MTSIVKSYAWVRIDSPTSSTAHTEWQRMLVEQMSIARAVAITWLALTCCSGFSGRENSVFWRHVFSELLPKDNSNKCYRSQRDFTPVVDTVGFFDGPSCVFPRFMFTVQGLARGEGVVESVKILCGVPGSCVDPVIDTTLHSVLSELAPFIDPEKAATRRVDVCLRTPAVALRELGVVNLRSMFPHIAAMPPSDTLLAILGQVSELAEDCNGGSIIEMFKYRRFRFTDFAPVGDVQIQDDADVDILCRVLEGHAVRVHTIEKLIVYPGVSRAVIARLVRSVLYLDPTKTQATVASITIQSNQEILQAIASALPYTRYIRKLTMIMDARPDELVKQQLPWLAYAIFHPESRNSTWRQLHLVDVVISEDTNSVMETMARGNNLLPLLKESQARTSDEYFSGQLRPSTSVYTKPTSGAEVLLSVVSDETVTVGLCGIVSADHSAWGEWVAVVVPTYGLGYVNRESVFGVEARPPSPSVLDSLRIDRRRHGNSDQPEVIGRLISVIGKRLRNLDIQSYRAIPSSVLGNLLAHCSSLRCLVVDHDGGFWSTEDTLGSERLPELEELELNWNDACDQLKPVSVLHASSTLRRLHSMRIRVRNRAAFAKSKSGLNSYLTDLRSLQYFHWCDEGADMRRQRSYDPIPYSVSRGWTAKVMTQLSVEAQARIHYMETTSRASVLAFLSVIKHRRTGADGTALTELHQDVLRQVIKFAEPSRLQLAFIEPDVML